MQKRKEKLKKFKIFRAILVELMNRVKEREWSNYCEVVKCVKRLK